VVVSALKEPVAIFTEKFEAVDSAMMYGAPAPALQLKEAVLSVAAGEADGLYVPAEAGPASAVSRAERARTWIIGLRGNMVYSLTDSAINSMTNMLHAPARRVLLRGPRFLLYYNLESLTLPEQKCS
jgi:hypothetical protein